MTTFCTISAPACRLLTDLHSFGEIFSPSSHFDNRRRPERPVGTSWHDRCTHTGRAFIEPLTWNWGAQLMTQANSLIDSVSPAAGVSIYIAWDRCEQVENQGEDARSRAG